jgi:probable HAF family extracellular repeat protein
VSGGKMVGFYADANSVSHGFLLKKKVFSTIDFPRAFNTQVLGINKARQAVGVYFNDLFCSSPSCHGFVRSTDGTFTPVDVPGASPNRAFAINNRGKIVGSYDASSVTHGFLTAPQPADGSFARNRVLPACESAVYHDAVKFDSFRQMLRIIGIYSADRKSQRVHYAHPLRIAGHIAKNRFHGYFCLESPEVLQLVVASTDDFQIQALRIQL